ncbi:MAG: chemotaxis protein CheB [Pseudanabaena sp. ELA607]
MLNSNNSSDLSLGSPQNFQESFAIAAIGASAGGLEASTQLLRNLPPDIGMGFVLIQHLAPDRDSQLSEILQMATQMPVHQAQEGMSIAPNNVYVIPPNTLMTLDRGRLKLEPRHLVRGKYMAIDGFFSSLAADRGSQAIAIVLSGSNEDGTLGLGAIKSVGGITFAQDIKSAEFPIMPMMAIASGYVDFVLSPTEIAAELVKIGQSNHEHNFELGLDENEDPDEDPDDISKIINQEFTENLTSLPMIFELLHQAMGINFSYYKKGTIQRRIARRMGLLNLIELDVYGKYLQEHPDEVENLYHDILINVTSFFRDPDAFMALKELVFPVICQNKPSNEPIRIWVAGCSSGEEVYSIAICLIEYLDNRPIRPQISIFATDISEIVISKARIGFYEENLLKEVSPERLSRFFIPLKGGYQIGSMVRDCCVFARQNLTSDPPFSRLDMISCRNMLIYLEPILQRKIMPIFHYALNPAGFLMLGSSEGIGKSTDLFAPIDKKQRIYKRKMTPTRMNFNFIKSIYETIPVNISKPSNAAAEIDLEQLADRAVLSRYAPVGVMIDEELEILQFRGQTSPYLEQPSGKASFNLLKMARTELKLELQSVIYNAKQQDLPYTKDGIEMFQGVLVKLDVIPLKWNSDRYFLVLFESRPKPATTDTIAPISPAKSSQERQTEAELAVARLTHELESTKKYLQAIVENHAVADQELRVASEEILSSNEELQSTNEELETAQEEVQATNEELNTVNDELRSRNLQLQLSNNDMQNLLSSVNIAILMLSSDLRIRRFTPMTVQILNLIPTDVGRPVSDIQTNIDGVDLVGLAISVIDTLIPYEQEVQDRSQHWYSLRIRPYRTLENVIDGVVISLIDIDSIKKYSIELAAAMLASEAANEAKSRFLTTMSHELRTPLNSILGLSESLKDEILGSLNEKQLKAIATVESSGEHLLSLINDILDLSKISSGKMELDIASVSVKDLCISSLSFIKHQAFQKRLQLNSNIPPDINNINIDERRIKQVLINLLTNSVKFTPNGGNINLLVTFGSGNTWQGEATIPQRLRDMNSPTIVFQVVDTGIGIAPNNLQRLFQPFVQVDSALNRQYEGTGIGLALVKQIVELHGGQVMVESEVGQGSCFTVALPYDLSQSSASETEPTATTSLPLGVNPEAVNPESAIAPLILLAEDNEANIETFTSYLTAINYRIIVANNGEEVVAMAKANSPDIILMDIQMPGMDGIEAMKQIRLDLNLINTPIIALTALAMEGDREKCLKAGANEYLSKPTPIQG